jgi:hypothetical protein
MEKVSDANATLNAIVGTQRMMVDWFKRKIIHPKHVHIRPNSSLTIDMVHTILFLADDN